MSHKAFKVMGIMVTSTSRCHSNDNLGKPPRTAAGRHDLFHTVTCVCFLCNLFFSTCSAFLVPSLPCSDIYTRWQLRKVYCVSATWEWLWVILQRTV